MSNTNHHFFASCALGWATASTRKEAVEKLCFDNVSDIKRITTNLHKKGELGCYVWSCRVEVSEDTEYRINFFSPEGVPKTDGMNHHVQHITAKAVAYWTEAAK